MRKQLRMKKMAKLSVARINYIIANINDFDTLTYIKTTTGASPEVKTPSRETVCNIIVSCIIFRNFGHESAKINAQHNGDNSIIVIEIFSQSPDKSIWINRTIYLKTTLTHCFNLGI